MGPFCSEQGTSSHETFKDLASIDEKIIFSGGDIGAGEWYQNEISVIFHYYKENWPMESVVANPLAGE